MTPEQTARERAQAEADRTGKPHVVLHSDQYGFEAVSVEWWASYHEETPGTSFREVQRIDPAPAKGPVEVRMLCESESYNHGYDEGYRQGHIDGKAAQRHTAPAPPAPSEGVAKATAWVIEGTAGGIFFQASGSEQCRYWGFGALESAMRFARKQDAEAMIEHHAFGSSAVCCEFTEPIVWLPADAPAPAVMQPILGGVSHNPGATPAPPAPLARDMTRELAEALQECVWAMMGVLQGDEPREAFPKLAPMMDLLRDYRAVLAAEGRK